MKKLWFRAKNYGYGWCPSALEGWVVLLAYLALLFAGQFVLVSLATDANGGRLAIVFIAYATILTAALAAIAAKTGERPGWRWGRRKK